MVHVYLTLPHPETTEAKRLVEHMLESNAGVGLVQTAVGGDEEIIRRIAEAHITACDGLIAVTAGGVVERQAGEIETATAARIPVLVIPTGVPFDPAIYLGFIERLHRLETAAP